MNPNLQRIIKGAVKERDFSPPDISNLLWWLDGADVGTFWADTAGTTPATTNFARWDDKSGNGYNVLQSTAGNRPQINNRTVNGHNVADFDGTNDWLDATAVRAAISATNLTIVYFYATDAATTTQRLLGFQTGATTNLSLAHLNANLEFRIGASAQFTYTRTPNTSPHSLIMTQDIAGSLRQGFHDGNSVSSAGGASVTYNDSSRIGSTGGNAAYLNGIVLEVLAYSKVLSSAEKNKIGGYGLSKWGITSAIIP